jgi:ketosteroid isomerase-like protein
MTLSLQEISDRLEIEQLLVRYCDAIDRRDWDAFRSVFTPDAVIEDVTAGVTGVDAMVEFLPRALAQVRIAQHTISTMLLDVDGDRARARTVCHCPMVVELDDGGTQVMFQGLWYVDELVRTTAGWRIARRAERDYYAHNVPDGFSFD